MVAADKDLFELTKHGSARRNNILKVNFLDNHSIIIINRLLCNIAMGTSIKLHRLN